MNKTIKGLSILIILFTATGAFSQTGKNYINFSFGPHASFTQNVSAEYGYGRGSKLGLGYTGDVSYYHISPGGIVMELGTGYYSFRQSVDTEPLHMFLGKNELSYRAGYLQAFFRAGYNINIPKTKICITPMLGTRFLFYLPFARDSDDSWHNVNLSLFESNDIMLARYRQVRTDYRFWTFIFHTAVNISYPLTRHIDVRSTIFWDMGFKALRADGFHSEQLYYVNNDYYFHTAAVNKGDAIGILVGISYRLK